MVVYVIPSILRDLLSILIKPEGTGLFIRFLREQHEWQKRVVYSTENCGVTLMLVILRHEAHTWIDTHGEQDMARKLSGKFCMLAQPSEKYGRSEAESCAKLGQCQACRDYQAGKFKPRYPLPAIPSTWEYIEGPAKRQTSLVHTILIDKTHWRVK